MVPIWCEGRVTETPYAGKHKHLIDCTVIPINCLIFDMKQLTVGRGRNDVCVCGGGQWPLL